MKTHIKTLFLTLALALPMHAGQINLYPTTTTLNDADTFNLIATPGSTPTLKQATFTTLTTYLASAPQTLTNKSLSWSQLTSKPTTISGYGITDPIVLTSGSYTNPSFISSLAWSKITSSPFSVTSGKTETFTNSLTFSGTDGSTLNIGAGGTLGTAAFTAATAYQAADATLTTLSGKSTTGSGSIVLATSPTLVTPTIGVATATSINGLTINSSTGTLTITNGKTVSVSNTLTFAGTDSSTLNIGAGGTLAALAFKATAAEGDLSTTDITANNATTSKHGYLPKLGGGSTNFLRADGTWAAPSGGGGGGSSSFVLKSANYTAVAGDHIMADVTGGTWNFTLPASPSDGDVVELVDSAYGFASNPLFISPNGNNIILPDGTTGSGTYSAAINGEHILFVYRSGSSTWQTFVAQSVAPAFDGDTTHFLRGDNAFAVLTYPNQVRDGSGGIIVSAATNAIQFFASGSEVGQQNAAVGGGLNLQSSGGFVDSGNSIIPASDVIFAGSNFTGGIGSTAYTINDLVHALKAYGLLAP